MSKRLIKPTNVIAIIIIALLCISLLVACTDSRKFLVIVEKGGAQQVSFAKSITTNDEKSVKFIDENDREQYLTGDYITISAIKSKDKNLIIVNSEGIMSLVFPKEIIKSSQGSATYLDEKGNEKTVEGEITIINIRENK
jgi:hypothetical protein